MCRAACPSVPFRQRPRWRFISRPSFHFTVDSRGKRPHQPVLPLAGLVDDHMRNVRGTFDLCFCNECPREATDAMLLALTSRAGCCTAGNSSAMMAMITPVITRISSREERSEAGERFRMMRKSRKDVLRFCSAGRDFAMDQADSFTDIRVQDTKYV